MDGVQRTERDVIEGWKTGRKPRFIMERFGRTRGSLAEDEFSSPPGENITS